MSPRVTVIVPTYNGAELLPQTLESVLGQTFAEWEVVVVDDGSADDSHAIAQSFASAHPDRITAIRLPENRGVGEARMAGIRASRGELLCLLDQDDLWDERYLERSVDAYDQATAQGRRIGVVSSNALMLTSEGVTGETWWDRNGWTEPVDLDAMIRHNYLLARSLFPRAAYDEAGGEFAVGCGGSDDYDLWLRMLEAGYEAIGVREPLAYYRDHESAFSRNRLAMAEGKVVAYRRALGRGALNPRQRRAATHRLRHFRALRQRELFRRALQERRLGDALRHGLRAVPHGLLALVQDPRRWPEWGRDALRAAAKLRRRRPA